MPYPSTGLETARPDLADTLFEFDLAANMNSMVAFDVFPLREVQEFKGDFGRVEAKELLKRHVNVAAKPAGFAFERAPRAAYPEDESKFTTDTYRTVEHGLEGIVDDNEADAYRSYFEFESFVTARINNQLLTETEVRVSSAVFDTTVFTPGNNNRLAIPGGEIWSDPTGAKPIEHVLTAMFGIYNNSGVWPDSIVMNRFAWLHLINTDQIRERIHAQGAGNPDRAALITREQVGQILQIPNVIVAGGTYDSANPSAAISPAQIWGPHAMVFKRANSRDLSEVALGRSFHWAIDDSMPRGYVESYRDPKHRADKIRVRHQMDNKLIYPEVGYMLQTVYS